MNIQPKFKLKGETPGVATSIRLFLYFDNQRFVFGTGKTILPELWDSETERPTKNRYLRKKAQETIPEINIQLDNVTARLNNLESEVKRIFEYWENQKIGPTKDRLKDHLTNEFKDGKRTLSANINTLTDYIILYIKNLESGTITTKDGKKFAKGTIKNYKGFLSQIEEYQKSKRVKLRFDHITIDFYDSFISFFNSKNYSPNTIGRHVKNLKTIMQAAMDENHHLNDEFKRNKFRAIQTETYQIYLTESEISKLFNLDLSKDPVRELARDVFLCGCYTGLRFSDYSRLRKEHITTTPAGTQVVEMFTKKTGEKVVIPIRSELATILKKYDWTLPKTHEQKVNGHIKTVGKSAGINTPVPVEKVRGGLTVSMDAPKYELIKTHTARRSFATNAYKAGLSSIEIMKITGHKTETNFLKYIRIGKEEAADRAALHRFFNPSPLKVAK